MARGARSKGKSTGSTLNERQLSIYFVGRDQIRELWAAARNGNTLAESLRESIHDFVHRMSPDGGCTLCGEAMHSTTMAFIVMLLDGSDHSLTSCICGDCLVRTDLDAELEAAVRKWMPDVTVGHVIVQRSSNATLH
jgi:hypothetical protein